MPNSLRARLKKCVHKGILKESDLERLIILPKSIESIEEVRSVYSRAYKEGYAAAIESLKQEPILDKIRSEIMAIGNWRFEYEIPNPDMREVLKIIGKQMAESEE